jgi:hypothetical protein
MAMGRPSIEPPDAGRRNRSPGGSRGGLEAVRTWKRRRGGLELIGFGSNGWSLRVGPVILGGRLRWWSPARAARDRLRRSLTAVPILAEPSVTVLSPRSRSVASTGVAGVVACLVAMTATSSAFPQRQAPLPPLAGSPDLPRPTEAIPLTPESLASRAEVIVHGTVESISIVRDVTNLFDERSFTAILVVDRVERGEGLAPGDRLTIDYWRRRPLVADASDSVGGYAPIPWQGGSAWVFARRDAEAPERLTPLLPNGWIPDEDRDADPEGTYGGIIEEVRDNRIASLFPWSLVAFAGAATVGVASLKAGPQSRGPMLLLALGMAVAGAALAFW